MKTGRNYGGANRRRGHLWRQGGNLWRRGGNCWRTRRGKRGRRNRSRTGISWARGKFVKYTAGIKVPNLKRRISGCLTSYIGMYFLP